jgi:glycosyltransferase involved in cell wall biosynthesis
VNLAGFLAQSGSDVKVVSFDRKDSESFYPLDTNVVWRRLEVGETRKQARLGETIRRIVALRGEIRKEQADIAVGFMHSAYVPLAFALVGTGIPVIGSEHIVRRHYSRRKLQYLLILASSFFIAKFTVLSERIKRDYHWLFRRKAIPLTNPVFRPNSSLSRSKRSTKRILSIGKLEPQKDHITLIRAFSTLAKQFPDWDLRIIGEGSQRELLENEVKGLGLGNRVGLPGATRSIGDEYAQADIFALPSRYGSFGLVTVEAMAMGLPVIGFGDCPGTNEVIENNRNGLLVEGSDRVTALAKGMKELMISPDLRQQLAIQGRNTASQHEPERALAMWEKLITELAK